MKSLRLRLALISTAISGAVIAGFGLAGWLLTAGLLKEAIDLRLAVPLDRIVLDLHPQTTQRSAHFVKDTRSATGNFGNTHLHLICIPNGRNPAQGIVGWNLANLQKLFCDHLWRMPSAVIVG